MTATARSNHVFAGVLRRGGSATRDPDLRRQRGTS